LWIYLFCLNSANYSKDFIKSLFWVFQKTQNSLVFGFKVDRKLAEIHQNKKYLLLKNASKSEITEIVCRFRAGKSRK